MELLNLYMDISPLQVLQELESFSKKSDMVKLLKLVCLICNIERAIALAISERLNKS